MNLKYLFTRLMNFPVRMAEIIVPMPIPFNSPKNLKDKKQAIMINVMSK